MQILRKETLKIAIIDPKKRVGEEGQYASYRGGHAGIDQVLDQARKDGMEIRNYVENILAQDGGFIPLKYVITEVPPMHVQPFHSHSNIDEINLISSGEVYFVESDTLTEHDHEQIREQGALLRSGDAVVSEVGKRHTVANFSGEYALIIGTISAKNSVPEFRPDWKR